jgi:cytochrome c5
VGTAAGDSEQAATEAPSNMSGDCSACHSDGSASPAPAPEPSPGPAPAPGSPPTASNGQQLFAARCAGCHGAKPPAAWATGRTAAQLTGSISNGIGIMPGYSGVLSGADMTAIVQFLQGVPAGSPAPTPTPAPKPTPAPSPAPTTGHNCGRQTA